MDEKKCNSNHQEKKNYNNADADDYKVFKFELHNSGYIPLGYSQGKIGHGHSSLVSS